eukprot:UN07975
MNYWAQLYTNFAAILTQSKKFFNMMQTDTEAEEERFDVNQFAAFALDKRYINMLLDLFIRLGYINNDNDDINKEDIFNIIQKQLMKLQDSIAA